MGAGVVLLFPLWPSDSKRASRLLKNPKGNVGVIVGLNGVIRYLWLTAVLAGIALLSGCIALPVPHDERLSPRFEGTVSNASTGQPLSGVKVTLWNYRYGEDEVGIVTAVSDERGHYSIAAQRHSNWVLIIAGPVDAFETPHLRFELTGYQPAEVVRSTVKGAGDIKQDIELRE